MKVLLWATRKNKVYDMRSFSKYFKASLFLLTLTLFSFRVLAQVECDEDGNVAGSDCPCQTDPALASFCGKVKSSGLRTVPFQVGEEMKDRVTTRTPVGGATVTLYSNLYIDKNSGEVFPSGKAYGKLTKKISECVTSQIEGKFYCPAPRVNDGNSLFVVFSCAGKVGKILEVPSSASLTGLNVEIDCFGQDNPYVPLPEPLDLMDENVVLACSTSTQDVRTGDNTSFPETYMSAWVGEDNYDIRVAPFNGVLSVGEHPGALYCRDCLLEYLNNHDRQYIPGNSFADVFQKCNCDFDGNGEGDFLSRSEAIIEPFVYSLRQQDTETAYRPMVVQQFVQAKYEDPFKNQQYVEATVGDCVSSLYLRQRGSAEEDIPPSCSEIFKCSEGFDRYRNPSTTSGIFNRLAPSLYLMGIELASERDPTDPVCTDENGAVVTVGEFKPLYTTNDCEPGTSGCPYKYDRLGILPFILDSRNTQEQYTLETVNDGLYSQNLIRNEAWRKEDNEATDGFKHGVFVHREAADSGKVNSGYMAARVATDTLGADGDVMGHMLVSKMDGMFKNYDINPVTTVTDYGNRITSLCSVSSANGQITDVAPGQDTSVINENASRGSNEDHLNDGHGGSTALFATDVAFERDAELAKNGILREFIDRFETVYTQHASGDGQLNFFDVVNILFQPIDGRTPANTVKAFGERKSPAEVGGAAPVYAIAEYCSSEASYPGEFPAYGEPGYPGNADVAGCFIWEDLNENDRANRWPGSESQWYGSELAGKLGNWPGIQGELRSVKVLRCDKKVTTRKCVLWDPTHTICLNDDIQEEETECTEQEKLDECLKEQVDTWPSEFPNPPFGYGESDPDFGCDLQRVSTMKMPGKLEKDQALRLKQEPFSSGGVVTGTGGDLQDQNDTSKVSALLNYTANALRPRIDVKQADSGAFINVGVSNSKDGVENDLVHEKLSGYSVAGQGTGAVGLLTEAVEIREGFNMHVEDYPPVQFTCADANCPLVIPPGPIKLSELDAGACAPVTEDTTGACPWPVGELTAQILGAAGAKQGVPGSVILAAMFGEIGGVDPSITDDNVAAWSEPWSNYISDCKGYVSAAQPPFGIIGVYIPDYNPPYGTIGTDSVKLAMDAGGFHPDRKSPSGPYLVNKCNFLDGAYMAAALLKVGGVANSCTASFWTADRIKEQLEQYRGGTGLLSGQMEIAQNCM